MSLSDKEVVQKVFVTETRHTKYRVGFIHTEDVKDFIRAAELIISNPLLPVETQLRNFRELVGDKLIERTLTPEEEDSLQGYKDACAEEELERIEG